MLGRRKTWESGTGVGSGNDLGSRDQESRLYNKKFLAPLAPKIPIFCATGKNFENFGSRNFETLCALPNTIHTTCLFHGLNRVAEEVRACF